MAEIPHSYMTLPTEDRTEFLQQKSEANDGLKVDEFKLKVRYHQDNDFSVKIRCFKALALPPLVFIFIQISLTPLSHLHKWNVHELS